MAGAEHDSDDERKPPMGELRREFDVARAQFDAANERLEQRVGRNLPAAIAVGVVLGAVLIGTLLVAPWLFALLLVAVAGLGAFELATALNSHAYDVMRWLVAAFAAAVPIASYLWGVGIGLVIVVIAAGTQAVVYGSRSLIEQHGMRHAMRALAAGTLTVFYVGMLIAFASALAAEPDGDWWVFLFIVFVVVNDTMAYVCGLTFGKHPMVPRVSPKKTWEGFLGAAVCVIIVAGVLGSLVLHVSWWAAAICGALVVITATLGDLFESIIKRNLGIKDMSSWLPGHGGLLDRLDAMLLTVPLAYLAYLVLSR